MKCNTDFLIVAYIVTMFVDWVFQAQWQAMHKSKWGKDDCKWISLAALLTHSIVYAGVSVCIIHIIYSQLSVPLMVWCLFLSHAIIDTRIPVKFILKLKGMSDEQISDTVNYGFMHIGIDHRLHEIILLILSFFV